MRGAYLAIDWGTTNRRIFLMGADGAVIETVRDDRGVLAMASREHAEELAEIRRRMGDLPVLCAGMVGSDRGWVQVPYVAAPCDLGDLAGSLHWIEPQRTAIVPGVRWQGDGRADIMRGEEVQLLGAIASGFGLADALLCQPGTHCKWVRMRGGRIAEFCTAMTGEMFALLRHHALIGSLIAGPVADGPSFAAGVSQAQERGLLAQLFSIRANHVLDTAAIEDPASFASGLLIGTDIAAQIDGEGEILVLADRVLGGLYKSAIETQGGRARVVDSHACFVAGIHQIWSSR